MTTAQPPSAKTPASSPSQGEGEPYKDGLGQDLSDDAFLNDPGPPRDPAKTVSKQALDDFDAQTARLKAQMGGQ